MAKSAESGGQSKNRLVSFYKKFNKISAALLLSAGVVFDSGLLLGLGAIDAGQAYLAGRFEKWNQNRKNKNLGGVALSGATS